DRWFRRLQLLSSAAYSTGHGGNDAQKTMGVIWLLLIANGVTTEDHLPTWVVMSCFVAIGIGTMFGGWRIVKTMGQRITKLKPVGGFAAECAGSIALFMATYFSIPVSTTHTITGAIIGVGTTCGTSAAHGVDGVVQNADEPQANRGDQHPTRHRDAEHRPVDVGALPAAGHHFADDFEQRKHLQQVVEGRSAGGHRAGRLMLNPHVAPRHPGGRCRGEEHESGVDDGAVIPHAMQACE